MTDATDTTIVPSIYRGNNQTSSRLRSTRSLYLVSADIMAIAIALLMGGVLASIFSTLALGKPYRELFADNILPRALQYSFFGMVIVLWFWGHGHYQRRLPSWMEARDIAIGVALVLLGDGFVQFAIKADFSRLWLTASWLLALVLFFCFRAGARALLRRIGAWFIPAIVIGSTERAQEAMSEIESEANLGYRELVRLNVNDFIGRDHEPWQSLIERGGAEIVILVESPGETDAVAAIISELSREGVPFVFVPAITGLPVVGLDRQYFFAHDTMLLVGRNNLENPLSRLVKMCFDYVATIAIMIVSLPLFIVFAAIIAADGGPVFFGHARIGRHGIDFKCLKFRTMVVDAEGVLKDYLAHEPEARAEWDRDFKLKCDPRVTPVGRFLRATSLDELPQIFNVLRGEMSLVGPRPIVRDEIARYGKDISYYTGVRPGVTGLWQVSGRNEITYAKRVALDSWYVRNWSLWHDIAILIKTIPAVIARSGAY